MPVFTGIPAFSLRSPALPEETSRGTRLSFRTHLRNASPPPYCAISSRSNPESLATADCALAGVARPLRGRPELSHSPPFAIIDLIMTPAPETVRLRLNENGRIVIPASIRKAVGIRSGEEVILWAENGEVRITTAAKRARRAQQLLRKYVPEGVSLSDELIAERRREAERE